MKRRGLALFAALCALSLVALAPAASASTAYSFNLHTPNTAVNPGNGDIIRVTGSGTFDTTADAVVASGSFTHAHANGALVARGVWVATGFDSFVAFGGPSPGFQGGVLEITATLFPVGEAPVTGVPIKVTCLINAPDGFIGDEGTTVGPFKEQTGGETFFHLSS